MNNKSNMTCLAWLLVLVVGIVMTIIQGWVLTILWGWFIVPTFHLPELSIAVAIGISFIIDMFKPSIPRNKDESLEDKLGSVIATILSPFITLLLGYIVHLFV